MPGHASEPARAQERLSTSRLEYSHAVTPFRRTKIVATIGAASSSPAVLRQLFDAGLNMARVTMAHGTIESQLALITTIRREADAAGAPIGILADLPGPKVRTTAFARVTSVAGTW
jgi:pyruvate kinase